MSLGHDPELPRGFQDADLEAAELADQAERSAALRRRGICSHDWIQGPPGPPQRPTKLWTCNQCGKVFASEAALEAEREELLG
jgi:hypothetical protein